MDCVINRASIRHKNNILYRHYVSSELLFGKVITQLLAYQGFLLFLAPNTPISFIFNGNVDVQFSMIKTPQTPCMINLKPPWPLLYLSLNTHPKNTLSTNIVLSGFPLLETTPTTQERTTTPNNDAIVAWDTLSHQQLTVDPPISELTRQYCNSCEHTIHISYS